MPIPWRTHLIWTAGGPLVLENLSSDQVRQLLMRFSVEALLVSVAVSLIYFRLGLREALKTIDGVASKLILSFLVLLTVVQLVDRWQYHFPPKLSFFPLARFAMYQTGKSYEKVLNYRFDGYFDGTAREINPCNEFAAVGLPSLSTRFRIIAQKLLSDDTQQIDSAKEQLHAYCDSIVRQRHALRLPVPDSIHFCVEHCYLPHGSTKPIHETATSVAIATAPLAAKQGEQ